MVEKTKWNRPLELSGGFKSMSERGIRFTSYREDIPGGSSYSWSQSSGSTFSSPSTNKGRRVPGPHRPNKESNTTE